MNAPLSSDSVCCVLIGLLNLVFGPKMAVERSSKASVNCRQTAYCHIPENGIHHGHHLENLKSHLCTLSLNKFSTFSPQFFSVSRLLFCSYVSYAYHVENCAILKMGAKTIPESSVYQISVQCPI
jgi:hypothetical protein